MVYIFLLLGCYDQNSSLQGAPKRIYRPSGAKWYSASCLHFSAKESITMDYVTHHDEVLEYWFLIDGKYVGALYIGPDSSVGKVEKRGVINGLTFEYYQNSQEKRYLFHTGPKEKEWQGTYVPYFFELIILKGHESDMASVLRTIAIGGPEEGNNINFETKIRLPLAPIPIETKSLMSKCHLRWDMGREYYDGVDMIAVLRNLWYKIGADWIPLEGETGYPNIPEHLKR